MSEVETTPEVPVVAPAEDVANTSPETAPVEEELSAVQAAARKKQVIQMGGGAVACVICEKRSYPAETISFEQLPYHANCFKCFKCTQKMQGTVDAAVFDHKLYCRRCFQNEGFNRLQAQVKWTPKTGGSSVAPSGAFAKLGGGSVPCTNCTKSCYPAETVNYDSKPYHAKCLSCSECSLVCTTSNINKFEDKLYCGKCWKNGNFVAKQAAAHVPVPAAKHNSAIAAKLGGGSVPCTTCSKACYTAEIVNFDGKPYHDKCLACSECALVCTTSNINKFEDKLYCGKCWKNGNYVAKQAAAHVPVKSGNYSSISAKLGGGSVPCTVCTKSCYPAETVNFETKPYHAKCLACSECHAVCTTSNINQFEDVLYCGKCWKNGNFVAKQAAAHVPVKSGNYSAISKKLGGGSLPCTVCAKACYPAETVQFEGKPYHANCIQCSECNVKTTTSNINQFDDKLYCGKCWKVGKYAEKQLDVKWEKKEGGANPISAKLGGGGSKCYICTKTVYPAEIVSYESNIYHAQCFNCKCCGIRIHDVNLAQHKNKEAYCAKCFQELGLWRADA